MFSLFKRAQKGKPVLIVDVESGSVAVAIVETGAAANVLHIERVFLPIEERSPEQLTKATTSLLSDLLSRFAKKYAESEVGKRVGPPTALYAVIGSPWVRSRTAIAESTFKDERPVTDRMIKNLAKEALNQPCTLNVDCLFENSVARVQLNGYATPKPVGKQAHHIAVTVFQSDIDMLLRKGVEDTLHQVFPGRTIDFRSHSRVALALLHERAKSHHYLMLNVGATSTDCIAVHKEDANDHRTATVGVAHMASRVSGGHGIAEEVFSLLRMIVSDTCHAPSCDTVKANLARLEPELVKTFGDMFASMTTHRKIPNACFLIAHKDFAPWLEHFFARIDFAQFTVTAQPLQIESVTPEHTHEQVTWANGALEDTGIGLAATFVNNLPQR